MNGGSDNRTRVFFDTETTGLYPGSICQLSYIKTTGDDFVTGNLYFTVDYIEPGAQQVHGLTVDTLINLSENRRFQDRYEEVRGIFYPVDVLIAHNFNFDLGFIKAEFERCGDTFEYSDSLCTMRYFTNICKIPNYNGIGYKWPRLEELIGFFSISKRQILESAQRLFAADISGYHDARFDVTATYLCFKEAEKKGLL